MRRWWWIKSEGEDSGRGKSSATDNGRGETRTIESAHVQTVDCRKGSCVRLQSSAAAANTNLRPVLWASLRSKLRKGQITTADDDDGGYVVQIHAIAKFGQAKHDEA